MEEQTQISKLIETQIDPLIDQTMKKDHESIRKDSELSQCLVEPPRVDFQIRNIPLKDIGQVKTFLRSRDGKFITVDNFQQVQVLTRKMKVMKKFLFNLPMFNKKGLAMGNYVFFANIHRKTCAFNYKKNYIAVQEFTQKTNNFFRIFKNYVVCFEQGNVVHIKSLFNGETLYREKIKQKIRVIYDFKKTLRKDEYAISTSVGLYFAFFKKEDQITVEVKDDEYYFENLPIISFVEINPDLIVGSVWGDQTLKMVDRITKTVLRSFGHIGEVRNNNQLFNIIGFHESNLPYLILKQVDKITLINLLTNEEQIISKQEYQTESWEFSIVHYKKRKTLALMTLEKEDNMQEIVLKITKQRVSMKSSERPVIKQ